MSVGATGVAPAAMLGGGPYTIGTLTAAPYGESWRWLAGEGTAVVGVGAVSVAK